MWGRIYRLIMKELLLLWQDPKTRAVLIVPPLVQMIIFANAATFDVNHVALGIWDEDGSRPAVDLIDRFSQSPAFDRVDTFDHPDEVAAAISEQRVKAVLHLGRRFSADIKSGGSSTVQLIVDARRSNTALIIESYAQTIINDYNRTLLKEAGGTVRGGIVPRVVMRAWYNPNLFSRWFILPGLVALLTFVATVLTAALSVARERELGTFDQLLVTPLRPGEIVVGKVVPAFLIGLVESVILTVIAIYAYRTPFVGDPVKLFAAITIYLLSGVGIGLAISAVARTQQQAILGVFLFLAPAIILSGFGTPINNMPLWCRTLTLFDPIRYMLVVARGVFLQDMGWDVVMAQIGPMALIGSVTILYAAWLFGRRLA